MKQKKVIINISLIFVMLILIVSILYKTEALKNFNADIVRDYINSFGPFAGVIFVLICALRTLLIFCPVIFMVILGGNIFGPAYGFLYSMISMFICANIAFFISRFFGKDFVQKLLRGKSKWLDLKVEQHGFKIIFIMRISSIVPFDALSYAAGLTKVKYKDFILASITGVVIETFSLSFLGHSLSNPLSPTFILSISLVLLTVTVPFLYSKFKKRTSQ